MAEKQTERPDTTIRIFKPTRDRLREKAKVLQLKNDDVLLSRMLDYFDAHPEVLKGRVG